MHKFDDPLDKEIEELFLMRGVKMDFKSIRQIVNTHSLPRIPVNSLYFAKVASIKDIDKYVINDITVPHHFYFFQHHISEIYVHGNQFKETAEANISIYDFLIDRPILWGLNTLCNDKFSSRRCRYEVVDDSFRSLDFSMRVDEDGIMRKYQRPKAPFPRPVIPDYVLWDSYERVCLIGEERGQGKTDTESLAILEQAVEELRARSREMFDLTKRYARLPFIFAYAAAGKFVQLFLIDVGTRSFEALSDPADLSVIEGRFEFISKMMNTARLILYIRNINEYVFDVQPQLYHKRNVKNEKEHQLHSITFYPTCLVKEVPVDFFGKIRDRLSHEELYSCLNRPPEESMIRFTPRVIYRSSCSTVSLQISPICKRLPWHLDLNEFKRALKHILTALSDLHKLNFVHRDLCWKNVLFDEERNRYLLLDFEKAGKSGTEPIHKLNMYPDDLKLPGATYEKRHDMFFFSEMLNPDTRLDHNVHGRIILRNSALKPNHEFSQVREQSKSPSITADDLLRLQFFK